MSEWSRLVGQHTMLVVDAIIESSPSPRGEEGARRRAAWESDSNASLMRHRGSWPPR